MCAYLEDKKHSRFTRTGNFNLVYVESVNEKDLQQTNYTIYFEFLD